MNFIHILPILFLFSLGQDLGLNSNSTIYEKQIVMDPKEYYLIIIGILVGTLIFLFIAFSILFLRNKNQRRNSNRENNIEANVSLYEQRYMTNPLAYPYTFSHYNFQETQINQEENINQFENNIQNQDIKETQNVNQNTLEKNILSDSESCSSFEGFGEKDEYIEVKNKSLKRRVSSSDIKIKNNEPKMRRNSNSYDKPANDTIGKNKNNLMDELRKSLPNLIPKNMMNN